MSVVFHMQFPLSQDFPPGDLYLFLLRNVFDGVLVVLH